jgi:hypothetical protein
MKVEGIEERLAVIPSVADTVERRDAVVVAGDRLAVDDAGARAQTSQRLDDQRGALVRSLSARP